MSLARSAISSMNYFFLRTVTERMDVEEVTEELSLFLFKLNTCHKNLSVDIRHDIAREIIEGGYFDGMSTTDIYHLVRTAIMKITHNDLPHVARFYSHIVLERNQRLGVIDT